MRLAPRIWEFFMSTSYGQRQITFTGKDYSFKVSCIVLQLYTVMERKAECTCLVMFLQSRAHLQFGRLKHELSARTITYCWRANSSLSSKIINEQVLNSIPRGSAYSRAPISVYMIMRSTFLLVLASCGILDRLGFLP